MTGDEWARRAGTLQGHLEALLITISDYASEVPDEVLIAYRVAKVALRDLERKGDRGSDAA